MKQGHIKKKERKIRRKRKPQILLKSYSLSMIRQISIYVDRLENKELPNS